jgi:hypothetical protein
MSNKRKYGREADNPDKRWESILKNPKKLAWHLREMCNAYIATGAFLDEKGPYAGEFIFDELVKCLRSAGLYDDLLIGNLREERANMACLSRKYVHARTTSRAKSAKRTVEKLLFAYDPFAEEHLDALEKERKGYLERTRRDEAPVRIVQRNADKEAARRKEIARTKEAAFERAIYNMCLANGRDLNKERNNPREDLIYGDGR